MYILVDKSRTPVLMNDGSPFVYTSRITAEIGKRVLEGERKVELSITRKK